MISFLNVLFVGAQAFSAPAPYCEVHQQENLSQTQIPEKPSYFFRTFQHRKAISYASAYGNFIFDLVTQKRYQLPGAYDPVPLGEDVMSVPDTAKGMRFYSVSEIMSGNSSPVPLAISGSMKGVYQSVGLLEQGRDTQTFGVIVPYEPFMLFQKVQVTYRPRLKVEPLGQAIELCKNIDIKTPMISKDASEISGYDPSSKTTKIWKIDYQTNSCLEVDDLKVFAGKADFSYDGQKLAFHIDALNLGTINYFSEAGNGMSMNVFTYDRRTRQIQKISPTLPGDNAYYPVFRGNGDIVYAYVKSDSSAYFTLASPQKMKTQKINIYTLSDSVRSQSLLMIGRLWTKGCYVGASKLMDSSESVLAAATSLSREACRSLVRDRWGQSDAMEDLQEAEIYPSANGKIHLRKELLGSITDQDLYSACEDLE